MHKANPLRITPAEMARALGKQNADQIRAALRNGTYPIGCAYKAGKGSDEWIYDVPRAPFEEFIRTGRIPE